MKVSNRGQGMAMALLLVPCLAAQAGDVVLREDFSTKANGWYDNTAQVQMKGARGIGFYTDEGKYQLTPLEKNTYGLIPAPKQAKGDDVRMVASTFMFTATEPGAGGLACRIKDQRNFYGFMATTNGGWLIAKFANGEATILAKGAAPRQAMADSFDGNLGAECRGSTLRLTINGKTMGEAQDATFAGGNSGVMVYGPDMVATGVVFDDFLLEEL